MTVLDEAAVLVHGSRAQEYGHPSINLGRIATLWSGYLNQDLAAADVAALMVLLKIARMQTGRGSRDTIVDIAGYAALMEMVADPEPQPSDGPDYHAEHAAWEIRQC